MHGSAVLPRETVVLRDLADRTEAHTGMIILVEPELDAVEMAYQGLTISEVDMITLPEELLRTLKAAKKVGDSFSEIDMIHAIHYLAVQGRITLPNMGNGQLGRFDVYDD